MAIVAKKTIMSLFSDGDDLFSHQVRIVLAEKGVNVDILHSKNGEATEDLFKINPYGSVPTLIDRDLVLYDAKIIMEYLDERFPYPPLLPVYPVARAETRKMIYRVEKDWYSLYHAIRQQDCEKSRKALSDNLISLEPVFANKAYFLSDEFSFLDCVLSPLFWRLPQLKIEIPESCKAIHAYMKTVFNRETFQSSLSDVEKQLRAA